ncbi:MAG: hypothetical protein DRI86_11075 [Bacteroidetes bacterium]|nr:MAG: hypothetical protein DRI86_11075 [Bacteroidota bacterium]
MAKEFEFKGKLPKKVQTNVQRRKATIQETLNTLASLNIRASQVIKWEDDDVNATVIFCKRR